LNRFRCREITVSGRTITSADFHSFQIALGPIQIVPSAQSWTLHIAFEDGQLLTKRCIFQCDVLVTTENKNDEPNPHQNCIQHEQMTVPPTDGRINRLFVYEVLAKDSCLVKVCDLLMWASRRGKPVELYGIESFPPTLGLRAWQAYDEITSVGGLAASA
jgi:hypothetical protein